MNGDKNPDRNVAIFDGDNTLWDTNGVFTEAQKDILRDLAKVGIPADPERDFSLLRKIDDLLIRHFGRHEYDNTYLSLCLIRHFRGECVEDVEQVALIVDSGNSSELKVSKEIGAAFVAASQRVPALLPEVVESLSLIHKSGRTLMVLYSEGREARTKRICDYYGMSEYFDHIVLGDKSIEDWFKVKDRVLRFFSERYPEDERQPKIYVIGDRLERDIRPGNVIGATTIYKPGGYKGKERPRDKEYEPTIIVQSMLEVARHVCMR
jgi:phosphoglycolate phosphatase-like HAD superfamily hydrolase